jgi:hypothetical protein
LNCLRWEENRAIPPCVAAQLAALRFSGDAESSRAFSEPEWKAAVYYFDRNQLTLALLANPRLPPDVRRRIEKSLAANRQRIQRVITAFDEVAQVLKDAGIEFAVLKGFANWGRFSPDPATRLQYDLDLYNPHEAAKASDLLIAKLGYHFVGKPEAFPTDHLPALVRRTGWQWQGDFFAPEIPISVEMHFRLWDEATEAFGAPGLEEFWGRRVERHLEGRGYWTFDPADALCYASLHLLRHLLRGDVRAANIYELSYFLDRHAADDAFWKRWRETHPPELRRLQAICFRLAFAWFDCRLSPAASGEIRDLPAPVLRWFDHCAASPAESFFRPNKDELWLHLCLLDSLRKKRVIVFRRLFPARLPGPLDSVFIPKERLTAAVRLRKRWQYARYVLGRSWFHVRALAPTLSRMLMTRS